MIVVVRIGFIVRCVVCTAAITFVGTLGLASQWHDRPTPPPSVSRSASGTGPAI